MIDANKSTCSAAAKSTGSGRVAKNYKRCLVFILNNDNTNYNKSTCYNNNNIVLITAALAKQLPINNQNGVGQVLQQ